MDFLEIAERLGLPAALLLFFAYAMWRIGKWAGHAVVNPLVKGHLKFLDQLGTSVKKIEEILETIAEHSLSQKEMQERLDRACRWRDD